MNLAQADECLPCVSRYFRSMLRGSRFSNMHIPDMYVLKMDCLCPRAEGLMHSLDLGQNGKRFIGMHVRAGDSCIKWREFGGEW
jgi:hypothetical protein